MSRNKMFYKWISATLTNDESSSDEELINYFIKEGPMSRTEAKFYVEQRQKALLNRSFKLKRFFRF